MHRRVEVVAREHPAETGREVLIALLVTAVQIGRVVNEVLISIELVLEVHLLYKRNAVAPVDELEAPVRVQHLEGRVNFNVRRWTSKLLFSRVHGLMNAVSDPTRQGYLGAASDLATLSTTHIK